MNNFLSFLFVTLLSAFIYICYLYCLQNEYLNSYDRTVRIILGALSAPFFVCYYWSFVKCSFNNPGYVDTTWEANAEENNIQIEKRKIRNYTPNKYTICDKCNFLVRPERAHHCRVKVSRRRPAKGEIHSKSCKRCVLKMDHHCPWIGTCVGERNLKFFFLFLSYGLLTTVYIAITIIPKFILALQESESNKMNCQYVYFISRNITVIESSYTDKNPYDLGTYNNWKMVDTILKRRPREPQQPKDYLYPLNDIYLNINNVDMDDSFLASHNDSSKEENV